MNDRAALGKLDLELLVVANVADRGAALRAAGGKHGFECAIGRGRRRHAVSVTAVGIARAAPRSLRVGLRLSLREGSCLALAGTTSFFEELLQISDPRVAFGEELTQPGDLDFEPVDDRSQIAPVAS
ncbi:MAG: hypothetical protein M0020_09975 [Actinomycetota bacterium]|nr:hypothetical protein [Actinomycetota bacterium]